QRILRLRGEARRQISSLAVPFHGYEEAAADPQNWVLEHLLRGRCDRPRVIDRLLSAQARKPLRRIIPTALGGVLVEHARQILQAYRSLLWLPTYQQFLRLSPFYLEERAWQIWTAPQAFADSPVTSDA